MLAVGCGRIGFDPYDDATGEGGTSDGRGGDGAGTGNDGATCMFATTTTCVDDIIQVQVGSMGDMPGDLKDYGDGVSASCGGQGGGDYGLQIDALATGTYRFVVTASFTPVMYGPYSNTTCTGSPANCQGAAGTFEFSMNAGTSRVIVVDSNGACGSFNIHYEHVP